MVRPPFLLIVFIITHKSAFVNRNSEKNNIKINIQNILRIIENFLLKLPMDSGKFNSLNQYSEEDRQMKIAVLSDTHGFLRPQVKEIIGQCDAVLHAGDIDEPAHYG